MAHARIWYFCIALKSIESYNSCRVWMEETLTQFLVVMQHLAEDSLLKLKSSTPPHGWALRSPVVSFPPHFST